MNDFYSLNSARSVEEAFKNYEISPARKQERTIKYPGRHIWSGGLFSCYMHMLYLEILQVHMPLKIDARQCLLQLPI